MTCSNWQSIVEQYDPLIGRYFVAEDQLIYCFFGLVHGEDDYYYGMRQISSGEMLLLSCVGSLEEGWKFKILDKLDLP